MLERNTIVKCIGNGARHTSFVSSLFWIVFKIISVRRLNLHSPVIRLLARSVSDILITSRIDPNYPTHTETPAHTKTSRKTLVL